MNIHEFEALSGKSVSPDEYARFESANMNASESYDKRKYCDAIRDAKPEMLELIFDLADRVMVEQTSKTAKEKAIAALQEWLGRSTAYLSTRTDYARGYKEGIEQAKEIVKQIINETIKPNNK